MPTQLHELFLLETVLLAAKVFHAYKQQIQDGHDPSRFCAENFISIRAMRNAEIARDHLKKIMESIGLQMVSTDFQDRVV